MKHSSSSTTAPVAVPMGHGVERSSPQSAGRLILSMGSACVGTLVGFSSDGHPLVDFPANPRLGAARARSCLDLCLRDVGREVVLAFEEGDYGRPLLMGCLRAANEGAANVEVSNADTAGTVSTLYGSAIRLSASDSISLRCGNATMTLTRDGKVLVNGTYIETRASVTNRILGGAVRIN